MLDITRKNGKTIFSTGKFAFYSEKFVFSTTFLS